MITNFNLYENINNKLIHEIQSILFPILLSPDIDESIYNIQVFIGQNSGDVAGLFFSNVDDLEWKKLQGEARLKKLIDYLKNEDSYNDYTNKYNCTLLIGVFNKMLKNQDQVIDGYIVSDSFINQVMLEQTIDTFNI